jgi:CheY-like chemotaxis protein
MSGVRTLSRRVLQGCGYSVIEAGNAEDALQACANHHGRIHLLVAHPQATAPPQF